MITKIWPELADRLPEIMQALAPQSGVLGDARIYAFPGANGNGKFGTAIGQVKQLFQQPPAPPLEVKHPPEA